MNNTALSEVQQTCSTCPETASKAHLSGAEPKGPLGGIVLRQNGKHALHRPQDGSVNHDRPVMACLSLVLEVETNGQLEIELDGGTLELAHEGVVDGDVNLGAVEGAIARVHLQQRCPAVHIVAVETTKRLSPACGFNACSVNDMPGWEKKAKICSNRKLTSMQLCIHPPELNHASCAVFAPDSDYVNVWSMQASTVVRLTSQSCPVALRAPSRAPSAWSHRASVPSFCSGLVDRAIL